MDVWGLTVGFHLRLDGLLMKITRESRKYLLLYPLEIKNFVALS